MEWMWKAGEDSASQLLLELFLAAKVSVLLPTDTAIARAGSSAVIPAQSIAQVPSPLSLAEAV